MAYLGSFPLTVTVATMGYRSYKNLRTKAPERTVTGRGKDPLLYHTCPEFFSRHIASRTLLFRGFWFGARTSLVGFGARISHL